MKQQFLISIDFDEPSLEKRGRVFWNRAIDRFLRLEKKKTGRWVARGHLAVRRFPLGPEWQVQRWKAKHGWAYSNEATRILTCVRRQIEHRCGMPSFEPVTSLVICPPPTV